MVDKLVLPGLEAFDSPGVVGQPAVDVQVMVLISIGISLKRIADALSLTQETVGYSHSVADSVFGIMMNGR